MKKLHLDTTSIKNRRDLKKSFDTLFEFPSWNGAKLEEWLDMHALTESGDPALRRFRSQKPQQYTLEISGSTKFMHLKAPEFRMLILDIQRINRGYIERTGRPLINTILM